MRKIWHYLFCSSERVYLDRDGATLGLRCPRCWHFSPMRMDRR